MALLLEWTHKALHDTDEIVDFIFAENPAAAIEFEQLIQESARNLTVMPYLGRVGRISHTRELIFHPNYFIAYQLNGDRITVLRVLHCRRRYPL